MKTKSTKKSTNKSKKKYYKVGGIGITNIYPTPEEAFKYFMLNSKIKLLTDESSYGIIYKLILNPTIVSPYYTLRSNNLGSPVTTIIIKIVVCQSNGGDDDWNYGDEDKSCTTIENFKNEVNIQLDIYNQSKDNYEAICPSIIFAKILNSNDPLRQTFFNYFRESANQIRDRPTSESFTNILIASLEQNGRKYNFGLVAMEIIDDAETVYDLIDDKDDEEINNILLLTLYEHYRLFKLGYLHGDNHLGNVMFLPTYNYMAGFNGRTMILDFGASFKHNLPISEDLSIEQLVHILLDNMSPIWSGTLISNRDHSPYTWVTILDPNNNNTMLSTMDAKRQQIVDIFKETLATSGLDDTTFNTPLLGGDFIQMPTNNALKLQPTIVTDKSTFVAVSKTPPIFDFTQAKQLFAKEKITLKQALDNEVTLQQDILTQLNKN